MEFNREIATFQGAIISADNVHQFSTINSKGGNEEKVKYIIDNIRRFLEMERYIDEHGVIEIKEPSMRKFAMYIVLNSDLPVLNDMMDVADLEPLIWSIPTVSKYLMCEIVWQLHFEKFIYELIPACWPQMGLEVAESFIENFKYLSPTGCLNSLYKLSASCYELLCRLAYFKYQDDHTLSTTMTAVFNNLEKCLKYYTDPPNKHRLDSLSTDDLYKYKGHHLKALLYLVYDCLNMYNQNINTNCDDPIYKLTYSTDYLHNINCKVYDSPNRMVVECLDNSNVILLDMFQRVVMNVSVNIFCAWSEYEEDGKTFQQAIGELCHKVQEKLEGIRIVCDHPVVAMIQMMARKPSAINEIINSTDVPTIVSKISNNDEESKSWIQALVHYEDLHKHIELIRIVDSNLSAFDSTDSYKLYNLLKKGIIDNDQQLLFDLRLKLLAQCNIDDKHKIVTAQFHNQMLHDNIRQDNDFEARLNEMFNKFNSDPTVDLSAVLTLFYQSPREVYNKIFNLASHNIELIGTMVRLMILLKDYTKYYYATDTEACMIKIMKQTLTSCTESTLYSANIVKFICKLKENDIVSGSQLLILVVMPSIHTALVAENVKSLHIQLQVLLDAYTMEDLSDYRAPMLVMVAQIMDIVRLRTLGRFHMDAIQTLEKAIQFQKAVINTYRDVIPDTEGSWLRIKLRDLNLQPLNLYYFKSLWNADNRCFLNSVTGRHQNREIPISDLSVMLAQVLPFATLEEWCVIYDDMLAEGLRDTEALRVMHSTVAALAETAIAYRTDKTRAETLYCLTNIIHIMRYKLLTEPLTNNHVKKCAAYLAKNLDMTHPDDVTEIETIIMPFLAYLSTRKNDYNVNILKYFKDNRYHEIVKRIFPPENNQESPTA